MNLDGALCVGYDPKYWDTTTRRGVTSRMGTVKIGAGRIPRMTQIALAKSVCAKCPVITECRTLGMEEEEGIWGGTLPDERRARLRLV